MARLSGAEVWLVAGVGRLLPERMFTALCDRTLSADSPWEDDVELVPLDLVDKVVGPDWSGAPGRGPPADRLPRRPGAAEALLTEPGALAPARPPVVGWRHVRTHP